MPKLIFNIFFSFGIIFGILFICYTYFYKKRRDLTFNKLTIFLVAFTLNNIQILLVDNFTTSQECYLNNLHPFLFFVFVVPYFHAFIINYLKIESVVRSYVKLATIMFAIGMIFRIISAPFALNLDCQIIGYYVKTEEVFISLFSIFIFIKVIQIIYFKQNLYKNLLSYDKLQWIKTFLFFGILLLSFWVFAIIFNLKNYINPKVYFYYPLRIGSSLLIYWVAHTASFYNVLTIERVELRKKLTASKKTIAPVKKSIENQSLKYKTICDYFNKTECYLVADLTLEQLSTAININRSTLSEEINTNSDFNFNDFVNSFRVTKAKILLQDPDYKNYTIEAIGLECGFNSKSTFYSAFKKDTNTTPAVYKIINF